MTARLVAGVLAVACLASCLALSGCGAKEGQRVVGFDRGGRAIQEKKASAPGRYTLHIPNRPDITFRVDKGERVGFRRRSGGRVEAYAGENPPVELDANAARGAWWEFDAKAPK